MNRIGKTFDIKMNGKKTIISPVYTWPTSSEPGHTPSQVRCLVPLRACLHYWGRAPRQLDHHYGRSQFAPCSACALRFSKISTMSQSYAWPGCCDHENDNFHLLHFALFANSLRHSAYQLSPRCVVMIAFLCRPILGKK